MKMRFGTILAVGVCICAVTVRAANETGNVFFDAAYWFSGSAIDDNSNTYFDSREMREMRHVSYDERSHALNATSRHGASMTSSIAITNMPVAHPHACITNSSETCLYFRQPIYNPDEALDKQQIGGSAIRLPDLFTMGYQSNMTAVVRLRWEGPTYSGVNSHLLALGYGQDSDNGGISLSISSAGNLFSDFRAGGDRLFYGTGETYAIPSNVWVDVAISLGNGRICVYRAFDGCANSSPAFGWYKYTANLPSKAAATNSVGNGFSVGCFGIAWSSKFPTYAGDKSRWNVFRGQIQQVAIWNRTLSDAEVAEAFGCQAEKLRYGVPDGSSGEFAGISVSGTPEKPEDWRSFAPSLTEENPSLTLGFTLGAHESGLPQVLNVLSTPTSASGIVELSVNGQSVAAETVRPGVGRNFFVKKDFLVEGANTLTLTWRGTGTFGVDALALGGSWQVGLADGSNAEFAEKNRYKKTYYLYGPATWANRCKGAITTDTDYENNAIVFPMTAALAAGDHILEIPFNRNWSELGDDGRVRISVNGVEKRVFSFGAGFSAGNTLKLKLPDGSLVPGENSIEVRNVYEGGGSGVTYDYIRLRAVEQSGLMVIVL